MTDATTAGEPAEAVAGGLDQPDDLAPDQGELALADPRDDHGQDAWEAAAAAVLRKARRLADDDDAADLAWARLTRRTVDGVAVTPLGTPADLAASTTTGRPTRAGAWDVRVQVAGAQPALGHEEVLADLEGGATSVWVRASDLPDLATLLDGVLVDLAPVVLDVAGDPLAAAQAFDAWAGERELAPGTNLGVPATAESDTLAEAMRIAERHGVLAVVVDAAAHHDVGASDVQELAASLRDAVGALRRLAGAGYAPAEVARRLEFRYAATDEQLVTIAKLRAARRLWARVLELSGVPAGEAPAQRQHAVTSRAMCSTYDVHVNMLRGTVAAFAAGVGGADAVTVLPFDEPLGRPSAFGRRIARNASHLLIEESHVAVVADPAGGSYAMEKLTDDLAQAAWALFGRLEPGAADPADLDGEIAATVAARDAAVATRARPITGLTEFPDLAEARPPRDADPEARPVRRHGAAFEALRDEAPAQRVYLATLGTVAAHTARATFATNLLAAGGVAVDVAGVTTGPDDLVAAWSGQAVVCLAGTDAAYDEWGEAAAQALREAGARRVVVAGRPRDWADDSCAMGVDALAFLTRTREALA